MIVLGLGGAVGHDPAAALFIDGKVAAAADEERFNRNNPAKGRHAVAFQRFAIGIDQRLSTGHTARVGVFDDHDCWRTIAEFAD